MRFLPILAAASGLIAGSFAVAQVVAQGTTPALRVSLSIEAQPLRTALRAFESQTGLQVSYREEDVATAGVMAPKVVGELEPEEALRQLLSGTGLKFEFINPRLVRVSSAVEGASEPKVAEGERPTAMAVGGQRAIRLAQVDETQGQTQTGVDGEGDAKYYRSGGVAVPEVLIEGSRILNVDIPRSRDDAQPYVVFTREKIDQSGAANLEDFLKNQLPMNTDAVAYSQDPAFGDFGNTSSINLRGLGANQTLILVDGRRIAGWNYSGTPQQADINGIPLAAIERIEVLPTTASGIYGGSATGGVVNIVLRRDYSGIDTRLTYENTFDADASRRLVDVTAGFNLEGGKTNVLITASYSDAHPLLVKDRDFRERALAHRTANNPSWLQELTTPPLGATTNIRSLSGANLRLKPAFGGTQLSSPFTSVPRGYAGPSSDSGAALVNNAGQYNLDLAQTAQAATRGLLNQPKVEALTASIRREFTPRLQAFVDLAASNNTSYFRTNRATSSFILTSAAPANPFAQTIRVTTPTFGADGAIVSANYSRRATVGLIFELSFDWRTELDFTWSRSRHSAVMPGAGLNAAGTAAVSSGSLDVFKDTNEFPVDFSSFLNDPVLQSPVHSTLKNTTLRFSGVLPWSVYGGQPTIASLIEYRDEAFGDAYSSDGSFFPSRSQSVYSVYLETRVPLISEINSIRGIRLLELQLAARRDDYKVVGANSIFSLDPQPVTRISNSLSSTDPTVGLRFKPLSNLMFRASYGTGFLPPAVDQLVPDAPLTVPASNFASLRDPLRGDEQVGAAGDITLFGGGNPNLLPEQSESVSAGIVLTPRQLPGFRVSVDWTRMRKEDNITRVARATQADFENEQFVPGLIVRAPVTPEDVFEVGPVIGFNTGLFNVAETNVEAYDFALDYVRDTSRFGSIELSLGASRLVSLETRLTPFSPVVENAGVSSGAVSSGLKWKGSGALSWAYRNWRLSWTTRYFDSYWLNPEHSVDPDQGAAKVDSQTYHDLFATFRFDHGADARGLLSNSELVLGVKNIFNTRPPIDVTKVNGYSTWGDPRRASYYVSIRKSF